MSSLHKISRAGLVVKIKKLESPQTFWVSEVTNKFQSSTHWSGSRSRFIVKNPKSVITIRLFFSINMFLERKSLCKIPLVCKYDMPYKKKTVVIPKLNTRKLTKSRKPDKSALQNKRLVPGQTAETVREAGREA